MFIKVPLIQTLSSVYSIACLFVCPSFSGVVYMMRDVQTCPSGTARCRIPRLYINLRLPLAQSQQDAATLALLWIRCPSAGAEDSLGISVRSHYETEIVFAHSWCQAGSCAGRSRAFNDEKQNNKTEKTCESVSHSSPCFVYVLLYNFSFNSVLSQWQDLSGEGRWWHAAKSSKLMSLFKSL